MLIKRVLTWWYHRKIRRNEVKLADLKKKKGQGRKKEKRKRECIFREMFRPRKKGSLCRNWQNLREFNRK